MACTRDDFEDCREQDAKVPFDSMCDDCPFIWETESCS
jgi:hypothetical protein